MRHEWDDAWISSNYHDSTTTKDLYKAYMQCHDDQISYDTFKWHCRVRLGLKRPVFHMTDEQEDFLIRHFGEMSVENLRKAFNKRYGFDFKLTAFCYHTKRLGLDKWKEHIYTEDQEEFLRANAPVMIRRQLTRAFNETFNASLSEDAVVMHCWQKGYGALNDGRFSQDREMTIFLDGNPDNISRENMAVVNLKTFALMNNNGWLNSHKDIVEAGLLWCRLLGVLEGENDEINHLK